MAYAGLAEVLKRMKARKNVSDEQYDAAISECEGKDDQKTYPDKAEKPKLAMVSSEKPSAK